MDKLTAQSLKIGDRVASGENDAGDFTSKIKYQGAYDNSNIVCGQVVKCIYGSKVGVVWDTNYLNHPVYSKDGESNHLLFTGAEVSYKALVLEEEAKKKISALEQEYKEAAKLARVKVKAAVKLIKEANKIAKKAGGEGLSDMYEASGDLLATLDECGWQTSSMGC